MRGRRYNNIHLSKLDSPAYQRKMDLWEEIRLYGTPKNPGGLKALFRTKPLPVVPLPHIGINTALLTKEPKRLCGGCHKEPCICNWPYPSRSFWDAAYVDPETGEIGRWLTFGYSRRWHDSDQEGIERLRQRYTALAARRLLSGWDYKAAMSLCDKMEQRCRGKLFFLAKRIRDEEREVEMERLLHSPTPIPVDKFQRRLPLQPWKEPTT